MRRANSLLLLGLVLGAVLAFLATEAEPHRQVVTAAGPSTSGPGVLSPATGSGSPGPGLGSSAPQQGTELSALVPQGHVSVVVYDRATGTTPVSVDAHRRYTSASLVKLLIALDALDRGSSPGTVRAMLSRSDDDTASKLWVEGGETSIVRDAVAEMGLAETKPPHDPGRWGDTEITAADITRVYRYLMDRAPAPHRETILQALREATENGADGFRQYFGIPDALGPGSWAVKQGWSCCNPGRILHSTGLVDDNRYLVTVLTENPRSVGYETAAGQVTEVVKHLPGIR
ncbi:hypothetical protein CU254_00100 [Amycolatopsis sp. AA4]|uniref:hypothetical protein n=1 Tax=Actinomycetes TaxID=1760 RepID=UPI0001B54F80|nr:MULTISPECIES: hypothetical protein [Actinomycetes]ATY09067.1 hypothetical protein CU254_00100 [Amycolatopsis sp. AA4]EFL04348.1 predicted protein [Streptomyces sp. AA4]